MPGMDFRVGEGKDPQIRDLLGMILKDLIVGQVRQRLVVVDLQAGQLLLPLVPVEGSKELQMEQYQEETHLMRYGMSQVINYSHLPRRIKRFQRQHILLLAKNHNQKPLKHLLLV